MDSLNEQYAHFPHGKLRLFSYFALALDGFLCFTRSPGRLRRTSSRCRSSEGPQSKQSFFFVDIFLL